MDCVYSVPIPDGIALKVSFDEFELQDYDSNSLCK